MLIEKDKVQFLLMNKIWEKVKYELSLLGDFSIIIIKFIYYILVFVIVYNIVLPFLKFYVPKDLDKENNEALSVIIFLGLILISYYLGNFFLNLFKDDKE